MYPHGCQSPFPSFCLRTTLVANFNVSNLMVKGFAGSGIKSTSNSTNFAFSALNAVWHLVDHSNTLVFLVSLFSGCASSTKCHFYAGHSFIPASLVGSIEIPLGLWFSFSLGSSSTVSRLSLWLSFLQGAWSPLSLWSICIVSSGLHLGFWLVIGLAHWWFQRALLYSLVWVRDYSTFLFHFGLQDWFHLFCWLETFWLVSSICFGGFPSRLLSVLS